MQEEKIECCLLEFGSEPYKRSIELRRQVLRFPLGLDFEQKDLDAEFDQFHFAAFKGENLVGVLLLKTVNELPETNLRMRQVAIRPELQGHGIGSTLVRFSEAWSLKNNCKRIDLHARLTAVDFYITLGYKSVG